jgi:ATP-binding cassette subfamily C protein LapB
MLNAPGGAEDRPKTRWLADVVRPVSHVYVEAFAMAFFINILAMAAPIFTMQVYDRVVFYGGLVTLWGLVSGMAVVLVFDFVLRQSRARMLQRVALRIDVEVGERVFDKFLHLPLRVLESRPANHWQTIFRDVEAVRNALSGHSAVLLVDLPFAVLFVALSFVLAPAIAWILPVVLVVYGVLAWWSGAKLHDSGGIERRAGFDRDTLLAEMIAARNTIKALALDERMRGLWEVRHADAVAKSVARGSENDGYMNIGMSVAVLVTVVMTASGALAIIDQSLTMGALVASSMLSSRIIGPFNQLFTAWKTLTMARQAAGRLDALFAEEEERRESAIALGRPKGELTFDAVSFHYGDRGPLVLDALRAKIQPGAVHAIIGRNGSGKTTLLKIAQGLYAPTRGRVLIDGGDVSQFTRAELARWIGYVPQDCVLFNASIRDNIARGDVEASDDEVLRAARLAGVHDFVIDLPAGYATVVGEGGSLLSSGQRQRIALARALLGDPPILLLDEPSSNLDRQSEEQLAATLSTLAKDHNVLVVTHSPVLLLVARNVMLLDKGKILAVGPPQDIVPQFLRLQSGAAAPAPATAAAGANAPPAPIPGPGAKRTA